MAIIYLGGEFIGIVPKRLEVAERKIISRLYGNIFRSRNPKIGGEAYAGDGNQTDKLSLPVIAELQGIVFSRSVAKVKPGFRSVPETESFSSAEMCGIDHFPAFVVVQVIIRAGLEIERISKTQFCR